MWIDGLGDNLVRGEIVNQAEAALMHGLIDRRGFMRIVLGGGAARKCSRSSSGRSCPVR